MLGRERVRRVAYFAVTNGYLASGQTNVFYSVNTYIITYLGNALYGALNSSVSKRERSFFVAFLISEHFLFVRRVFQKVAA